MKVPFKWRHAPLPNDSDHIRILGGWAEANITTWRCEPLNRLITLNHSVKEPFNSLIAEWEKHDLIRFMVEAHATKKFIWSGGWVARYKRGKPHDDNPNNISNHSAGTAFDIFAPYYPLGRSVAVDAPIRDLVPIAATHGWRWGGFFNRADGMHFEHESSPFR